MSCELWAESIWDEAISNQIHSILWYWKMSILSTLQFPALELGLFVSSLNLYVTNSCLELSVGLRDSSCWEGILHGRWFCIILSGNTLPTLAQRTFMNSSEDGNIHPINRMTTSWERQSLWKLWSLETDHWERGDGYAASAPGTMGVATLLLTSHLQVQTSTSFLTAAMKESALA